MATARISAVRAVAAESPPPAERSPDALLEAAETALQADEAARAVALFGRFLGTAPSTHAGREQAYLGLAQAHEMLHDCAAAIRAYDGYLGQPSVADPLLAHARKGACEAELGRWDASAASFQKIHGDPEQLPSVRIEALARRGYALFMLDHFGEADEVLAQADAVFEQLQQDGSERLGTYYFVGMARFYRAAIAHRKFREVTIVLPEKAMQEAFKRKLELLVTAQDAYNHVIAAKHMFWVSASGYQLGHLFGEFYDALMFAPVPEWLDEGQRRIYYVELKKQLRPVIDKAVWVFEKNLETARRLGYESPFIDKTAAKLGHLQAVLRSDDHGLGQPDPRLVRELEEELQPPQQPRETPLSAADRKLFVPHPTPL